MENMLKTMREHFPVRTVVIEQSLEALLQIVGGDKLIIPFC